MKTCHLVLAQEEILTDPQPPPSRIALWDWRLCRGYPKGSEVQPLQLDELVQALRKSWNPGLGGWTLGQ